MAPAAALESLHATYAELTRELTVRTSLPDTQANPDLRVFLEGLPPRYLRTHSQDGKVKPGAGAEMSWISV